MSSSGFNGEFWILTNILVNPQILLNYKENNPYLFKWLVNQNYIQTKGSSIAYAATEKLNAYVERKRNNLVETLNVIDSHWMIKALLRHPIWPEADISVWLFLGTIVEDNLNYRLTDTGRLILNKFPLELANFSCIEPESYRSAYQEVLMTYLNKDIWPLILGSLPPDAAQSFADNLRRQNSIDPPN